MSSFFQPLIRRKQLTQHVREMTSEVSEQGPVARSVVSANRWLRGIKMYRFPWYLTLVSTNHASSNPGQDVGKTTRRRNDRKLPSLGQWGKGELNHLICLQNISWPLPTANRNFTTHPQTATRLLPLQGLTGCFGTSRFDTSWISRGVISLTYLA